VFHDWRWLLVYHPSWLAFGLEVVALVAVRSALVVGLVRAAWPATVDRPRWQDQFRSSVGITALVALVLLPFAVLAFAMAVVSLSWLFFVSVPVLVYAEGMSSGATAPRIGSVVRDRVVEEAQPGRAGEQERERADARKLVCLPRLSDEPHYRAVRRDIDAGVHVPRRQAAATTAPSARGSG